MLIILPSERLSRVFHKSIAIHYKAGQIDTIFALLHVFQN
jgi:hypothetical protein